MVSVFFVSGFASIWMGTGWFSACGTNEFGSVLWRNALFIWNTLAWGQEPGCPLSPEVGFISCGGRAVNVRVLLWFEYSRGKHKCMLPNGSKTDLIHNSPFMHSFAIPPSSSRRLHGQYPLSSSFTWSRLYLLSAISETSALGGLLALEASLLHCGPVGG